MSLSCKTCASPTSSHSSPEELEQLRAMCRRFANERLVPQAQEFDRSKVSLATLAELAQLGVLGVCNAEAWGGAGFGKLGYVTAIEEVSKGCASTAAIASVHTLYCSCIEHFGTDAQKKEFLEPFASGRKIGAFALTEANAGSDAANIKSDATLEGDHWIVTGEKVFVSNVPMASAAVVFVRANPHGGAAAGRADHLRNGGISAIIVPLDTPGVTVGRSIETLGIRGAPLASLSFDGCRVPKANLLGEMHRGFQLAMAELDGGRLGMAAQALGIAEASLALATQYSRDRESFGQPIGTLQAIQMKLADMRTRVESARLLTLSAAAKADTGERYTVEAAMAKLSASETATFCAHQTIQILGGYGFTSEFAAERHYRDARITELYEGTSEILRIVIARHQYRGGYR